MATAASPQPGRPVYALLLKIPHLVIERKMLLGIKKRATRRWASRIGGTLLNSFEGVG